MELDGSRRRPLGRLRHAVVARVDLRGCVLRLEDGSLLRAAVRGRLLGRGRAPGTGLAVGDRVAFEPATRRAADRGASAPGRQAEPSSEVVVTGVEPRRNAFSRRAAGRHPVEQVVAANLDQMILVAACAQPEFRAGLADRVLCQAERAGLPARVVLNKTDLLGRGATGGTCARQILDDYARAGYRTLAVSAKDGTGVPDLFEACRGRRTLFVGHSGVGKSTLLNALIPGLDLLVGAVNAKTGKGRHTTAAAVLLQPEPEFEVVDTPGVRAFALWGVGPDDLDRCFPEFRPLLGSCRFGDCQHLREPGCALRSAVRSGEIAERRFASFLGLRRELAQETSRKAASRGGRR